ARPAGYPAASAPAARRAAAPRRPGPGPVPAGRSRPGAGAPWSLPAVSFQGRRDRAQQVRDPRAPPGGDVVVEPDHAPVLHRAEAGPARPFPDRGRVLTAADGV